MRTITNPTAVDLVPHFGKLMVFEDDGKPRKGILEEVVSSPLGSKHDMAHFKVIERFSGYRYTFTLIIPCRQVYRIYDFHSSLPTKKQKA
jgi:hypothetical protein